MHLFRRSPRLRAAPPTVPLWVSSEASRTRAFFAPHTRVHIYESEWHRRVRAPRLAYSVPCFVESDGQLGTMIRAGALGRLFFLVPREGPWIVVPVAQDPATTSDQPPAA